MLINSMQGRVKTGGECNRFASHFRFFLFFERFRGLEKDKALRYNLLCEGVPKSKFSGEKIQEESNANDYFYDAVLWTAEKGITAGMDDSRFGYDAPCTRAQIGTFLQRTMAE